MKDIRGTSEYASVTEHLRQLHEPAFGRPSSVMDVKVSPDGNDVFVTGAVLDQLDGAPRTSIFKVRDQAFVPVLEGRASARSARPSPDGDHVAFLSDRHEAGTFQLFVAAADRLDRAWAAPAVDGTIEYIQWSPTGETLLMGVAGFGAHLAGGQGSGVNHSAPTDLPAWHPQIEEGVQESAWRSLWTYSLRSGELAKASPEGLNVWEASWCGNGAVAVIASRTPDEDAWYGASLWSIELESGQEREICTSDVQLGVPAASPNGRYVAVIQAVCSDRKILAGDLVLVDLESNEQATVETGRTDVTSLEWVNDDTLGIFGQRGLDSVAGSISVHTNEFTELYSTSLSCGPLYPEGTFTSADSVLLIQDSYSVPQQVVAVNRKGTHVLASVAHEGSKYLLSIAGSSRPVSWTAPDGLMIEGILCTPDGEGPFPLVVNIHGGPIWAFRDSWSLHYAWVPMLVARGYAVLNPNPRGSGGRGQDFAGRVVGDMGGADTHDYLSGIDALVDQGLVDPTRIGLIGGSYGGFMSSWLVTQDPRFAAAVPVAPVTNWYSQGFTSNVAGWGNSFLDANPEEPGSQVHTRSPVLHASKVRTPCLNVAGGLDLGTPPTQAQEFHHALRGQGVESVLAIYPLEGHGVRAFPALIDFLTRVMMWFERHMPASPSKD